MAQGTYMGTRELNHSSQCLHPVVELSFNPGGSASLDAISPALAYVKD